MATNNPINIPIPFSTVAGGTGVNGLDLADNGIMVSHLAAPMTSIVLNDNEVLVGVTGSAPVPTTLFKWNFNVTGPTVTMQGMNGYTTSQNGVSFLFPTDAALGDRYTILNWWNMVPGSGFSISKQGLQTFQFGGIVGTTLTTTSANASITLICVSGATNSQTFMVENTNGETFSF